MTKRLDFDVIVVGGGPTGLAAAIGFARRGLRVAVLEKGSWPIDKTCGEGIMPTGVHELARLGALPLLLGAHSHPFNGIEMISMHNRRVKSDFAEGTGLGVRRTTLSSALYECAQREQSLTLHARTKVLDLHHEGSFAVARTNAGAITSRLLVAADGLRSGIRAKLSAQLPSLQTRRYGANQHYRTKPWNSRVEVHFSNGLEAYVTPCSSSSLGIAFLWHYDRHSPQLGRNRLIDDYLENFPNLAERLHGQEKIGSVQTTGPLLQNVSRTVHSNIVLLGDAAGYFDAITGEGISLGLKEARLLVESAAPLLLAQKTVSTADLKSFAAMQMRMRRILHLTTRVSLWTARYPMIQAPVFSLLSKKPGLFQSFLSLNMGSSKNT